MIWLTWRQFRVQAIVVYAALVALAIALALTGGQLADAYRDSAATFLDQIGADRSDQTLYTVGVAVAYAVPAVIGAFWGAPMVARELEAGTHRLVWTQSVTRNRWLATKLGLGMLGAASAGGVAGLAMTWWSKPIDSAVNAGQDSTGTIFDLARLDPAMFGARGIAPIGYAAFAFALGVLAGAVLRRTVPAMAVTLVIYVLIQVAMPFWVRPYLVEPVKTTVAITADNLHGIMGRGPDGPIDRLDVGSELPGAWSLSDHTVDASGAKASSIPTWVTDCLLPPQKDNAEGRADQQACFDRLADQGYRQQVTYQPASHYWALQWRETGVMVTVGLLLVALAFWRLRRLS
ncbi:MAG TPA: ABC transporter permease subunit [Nocardioides sp.]|jgi:hypothetical protein